MKFENFSRLRAVYHQAGHVVAAYVLHVPIEQVSAVTGRRRVPFVQFGPLFTHALLADSKQASSDFVDRFVVARLAGPVAEMTHLVKRFRATGHQVHWTRWRKRWQKNLLRSNEVDLDFAYAAVLGWSGCRDAAELQQRVFELWKRAEELFRRAEHWAQLEHLVTVLRKFPTLTGAEAFAVIRPLAP